jgi:hypothetical protein
VNDSILNEEVGLFEYVYDLGDKGEWTVTLMRGEEVPTRKCDDPTHDHKEEGPGVLPETRYECNVVLRNDGRIIYQGCPDMMMPHKSNELVVSAALLTLGAMLNASAAVIGLKKQIGEEMGDQLVDMLCQMVGINSSDILPDEVVRKLAPFGDEVAAIVAQATESGNANTPREEIMRVFGMEQAPAVRYDGMNQAILKDLLDE